MDEKRPLKPGSLKEWQKMFFGIYAEKNIRDYASADLSEHLQEEAAKIDEGIRKVGAVEMVGALSHFFAWLLGYCNMMGVDAEQAIWNKYQGLCPYCGALKNCLCIANEAKPRVWFKNPEGLMPDSLDGWQEMFSVIYGRVNKLSWPIQVWLHVHEELGEMSRERRVGNFEKMKEELADVFAWFIGYCNRMNVNLDDLAWQIYPGLCDVCRQEKCQCPKV